MRIIPLVFFFLLSMTVTIQSQSVSGTLDIPLDTLLKTHLEEVRIKDQTIRLILPCIEDKFGKDSDEQSYIWNIIHGQDSLNIIVVKEILDNYGWVGTTRIGYNANQALWLVIQHAPLNIQEKYLPLLEESVRRGESLGWHLAFLQDRILMRKDQPQKFGTQAVFHQSSGKYHIYPIEDPNHVNERRKAIGLESIEEYATANDYVYHP